MKTFKQLRESIVNLDQLDTSQQQALKDLISENKPIFAQILKKYLPKGAKVFDSKVGIYFYGFAVNTNRGPFDSNMQFFTKEACQRYIDSVITETRDGILLDKDEYPEPKDSPISFSPIQTLIVLSNNGVDIEKEMHDHRGVNLATKTGIV